MVLREISRSFIASLLDDGLHCAAGNQAVSSYRLWKFELLSWPAAWHGSWDEPPQVVRFRTRIQQSIAHEGD